MFADERSAPGSRDIDHKTRGARVRERAAIESIRRGMSLACHAEAERRRVTVFVQVKTRLNLFAN
jgi:hypothetical protein